VRGEDRDSLRLRTRSALRRMSRPAWRRGTKVARPRGGPNRFFHARGSECCSGRRW
jgi:hypothetical protein